MGLDGRIASKASLKDDRGRWVFDTVADAIPAARLYAAVQQLRTAGFTVEHPGNKGIEICGPTQLYETILGKSPRVPSVERLDPERLKGTPYETLSLYVAGFEFTPLT